MTPRTAAQNRGAEGTLREALAAAAREADPFRRTDHGEAATQARAVRNELMRYAYARGAEIRQLCEVTGLTSTSTVALIVRRRRGDEDRGAVLDDPAPALELA